MINLEVTESLFGVSLEFDYIVVILGLIVLTFTLVLFVMGKTAGLFKKVMRIIIIFYLLLLVILSLSNIVNMMLLTLVGTVVNNEHLLNIKQIILFISYGIVLGIILLFRRLLKRNLKR